MLAKMSHHELRMRRRMQTMARSIAAAAAEADRLGLQDLAMMLREAEAAAKRIAPDRQDMH